MEIKKTSLNNLHKNNQAKFVEFAGYEMPIQYSKGIIEEHKFTRLHSGIFDHGRDHKLVTPKEQPPRKLSGKRTVKY